MRQLPRLNILFLGHNQIGDAGLAALAPALRQLPRLMTLNLSGDQIGDRGLASLLAEPMQGVLPSLHYIYLESNLLTDSGLAALASLRFAARLCRHSTSFTCPAIPRARRHRRPCSQASQQPCSSRDGLYLVLIECAPEI